MLIAACLLLTTFLGLMGLVLDQAFRNSAEQGVSERLLLQIYGLLAVAEESEAAVFMPEKLQEPDFNQLGTGLYALILDSRGKELWRSASALDLSLNSNIEIKLFHQGVTGKPEFGRVYSQDKSELFFLSYRILWQVESKPAVPYVFVVLQTMDPYLGEVRGFRNSLWGWLFGVVVTLIVLQGVVISWGLSPLKDLARDLKAIEDGEQEKLEAEYPEELEGITRNLNLLLSSERRQREKYRTTLADLAHSLKTPLAILRGAASILAKDKSATGESVQARSSIDEQVLRMDQIVSYQLERAVVRSPKLARKFVSIYPVIKKIVDAMEKIYDARHIHFQLDVSEAVFFGDERDIMELLGNVIDNACKYGAGEVKLTVNQSSETKELHITVEDNGSGIKEDLRQSVLMRGARLDSTEPGQGIGLAIVSEIVARYEGSVFIDDSALGGARVVITT